MRTSKTVNLGASRDVTVLELRVRDVRRLLAKLPELKDQRVESLLSEHLPDTLALLGDSVVLPKSEDIDDLTLSECRAIGEAWWELHRDFFTPILNVGRALPSSTRAPSTAPASASSKPGTRASGTTAGDSTSSSSS